MVFWPNFQRYCVSWIAVLWLLAIGAVIGTPSTLAAAWSERDVAIEADGVGLHGTLTVPDGDSRVAGVLLLPGSGPTDRNGNQPQWQNDLLRLLAQGLAEAGIASLRADKRGVGRSVTASMREADFRFDSYVADALRWIQFLRVQPRVGSVFIVGHSEGALIGTLAAQRTALGGFVSIAGSGLPICELLRRQIAPNLQSPLRDSFHHIIDELQAGREVVDIPSDLVTLFRPSVQPYLISQCRYDPAVEIAKLHLPILIVQGDRDIQVSIDDAERLATAAPSANFLRLSGVNHMLRPAPQDRPGNIVLYNRPDIPLAPPVLPAITAFMAQPGR